MTKLSKVNKNNSLAVILPKKITEDIWKANTEVDIEGIGTDAILITRDSGSKGAFYDTIDDIIKGLECQKDIMTTCKNLAHNNCFNVNEDMVREGTKRFLIEMIKKL